MSNKKKKRNKNKAVVASSEQNIASNNQELDTLQAEQGGKADESAVMPSAEEAVTASPDSNSADSAAEEVKASDDAEPMQKGSSKKREAGVEITKITVISDSARDEIKKTGEQLKKVLGEALDENAEDLGHTDNSHAAATAKKISLKQAATSLFGFAVLVLAILGIISSARYIAAYIDAKNDDSALKQTLLSSIAPLTASDTSTFENPESISEDVLITCACWDIILNPMGYTQENSVYTVSHLDIDKRIAGLFGTGLSYTHKSVGDEELSFEFDQDTGMYTIPAYPSFPAYIPQLIEYTPTADGYKVRVAYLLPITEFINAEASAEKVMLYTVKSTSSGYAVYSLELSELLTGQEL